MTDIMMLHAHHDNTKCRTHHTCKKKMEEDGGFRTVECLRGRLLAERQASRAAKEEAELMTKKIAELEVHLKEEIKLRERAEKRLKLLMKKLESLKGSSCNIDGSKQSSSSAVSCVSSMATSVTEDEEKEAKIQIRNLDKTHDGNDLREDMEPNQVTANPLSMEENSSSGSVASTTSHEEPKPGASGYSIEFQ